MKVVDPLPKRYLTSGEGVGGRIKVRPEDFLVDEIPLYEPQGAGEHVYLGIEKSNVAHGELIACLRRHFHVSERAIGFAGMKDKIGITRQTVSIHLPNMGNDLPNTDVQHARIKVLWATRHRNKIRLGHLAGNRFSIRIRDVDPMKAPVALRTLRTLEQAGVPNYFGSQRFGYRRNNHIIGAAMLRGDWETMTRHLLGTAGGHFPLYQRPRRELFDQGKFAEAAEQWTTADRAERIVSMRLAAGKGAKEACLGVGQTALAFWISALQSAIFNCILDQRLDAGMLADLCEGDIAFKHSTRGVFPITADELASGDLMPRLATLEISPSGPLWGKGMVQPQGEVGRIERDALFQAGLSLDEITNSERAPEGGRRPVRVPLHNASVDGGIDEHGNYIRLAFDLPRGSYATIVLREIMKNEETANDDDD